MPLKDFANQDFNGGRVLRFLILGGGMLVVDEERVMVVERVEGVGWGLGNGG